MTKSSLRRNPNVGENVGTLVLLGAIGIGAYYILKPTPIKPTPIKPTPTPTPTPTPIPNGTIKWKLANIELGRQSFQIVISEPKIGDWRNENEILDKKTFSVDVIYVSPAPAPPYGPIIPPEGTPYPGAIVVTDMYQVTVTTDPWIGIGAIEMNPRKELYSLDDEITYSPILFPNWEIDYWEIQNPGETQFAYANPIGSPYYSGWKDGITITVNGNQKIIAHLKELY